MLLVQGGMPPCSLHRKDASSTAKVSQLYLPVLLTVCVCGSASHRGTVACGEARQIF